MATYGSARRKFFWTLLITTAAACGGSSGGGGNPTSPSPAPSGPAATIVISSNGVSPDVVDISPGQRVEFVNNGSRVHQIFSTPHGVHTDCPPINEVSELASGQRRTTGVFSSTRLCGFHDHMDPSNNAFRGTIRVGTTSGPVPEY